MNGLLARGLHAAWPGAPSLDLMFSYPAIVIGLVHAYLPYMILTCYISLQAIDDSLVGSRTQPRRLEPHHPYAGSSCRSSLPGIARRRRLIFVPVIGSFMEPRILGGQQAIMLGTLIEDQFTAAVQLAARRSAGLHACWRSCLSSCGLCYPVLKKRRTLALSGQRAIEVSRHRRSRPISALLLFFLYRADPRHDGHGLQRLGALRSCRSSSTSSGSRRWRTTRRLLDAARQQRADRHRQHRSSPQRSARWRRWPSPATSSSVAALLQILLLPPIAIPWLITGTAMLIFFFWTRHRARAACHPARPCGAGAALCRYRGRRRLADLRRRSSKRPRRALGATPVAGLLARDAAADGAGHHRRRRSSPSPSPSTSSSSPISWRRPAAPTLPVADLCRDPQGLHARDQCDLDHHHRSFRWRSC